MLRDRRGQRGLATTWTILGQVPAAPVRVRSLLPSLLLPRELAPGRDWNYVKTQQPQSSLGKHLRPPGPSTPWVAVNSYVLLTQFPRLFSPEGQGEPESESDGGLRPNCSCPSSEL